MPPQVVRSSGRISKELPILLIGDDLSGVVFSERTKTVVLSLHGAGIHSKHKLSPEQELILRWPDRNKETEIRVVGQIGSHNGLHTYGVAFVNPRVNFWEEDFPPVSDIEREMGYLNLVCNVCKARERVDDTSIEADICATNEGVMRFCKRCGISTLWKPAPAAEGGTLLPPVAQQPSAPTNGQMPLFPGAVAPPPPTAPAPAAAASGAPASPPPAPQPQSPQPFYGGASILPSPAAPAARAPSFYSALPLELEHPERARAAILTMAPVAPGEQSTPAAPQSASAPAPGEKPAAPGAPRANRRKHPRVKVNYSACVRHPQRGDDIVLCEDMSKGGLRFKSRRQYYAQTLIEIAAPYQPGQPAIFVPAQIVYVEELPEQQLYRYGVQYLRATRARDTF